MRAWSLPANGGEKSSRSKDEGRRSKPNSPEGDFVFRHAATGSCAFPAADPGATVAYEYETTRTPLHSPRYLVVFNHPTPVRQSRFHSAASPRLALQGGLDSSRGLSCRKEDGNIISCTGKLGDHSPRLRKRRKNAARPSPLKGSYGRQLFSSCRLPSEIPWISWQRTSGNGNHRAHRAIAAFLRWEIKKKSRGSRRGDLQTRSENSVRSPASCRKTSGNVAIENRRRAGLPAASRPRASSATVYGDCKDKATLFGGNASRDWHRFVFMFL